MKKGRPPRRKDALDILTQANMAPKGAKRDGLLLAARIIEVFGRISEEQGHHAGRPKGSSKYEQADKEAQTWMLAEFKRTKINRPYTLAKRYLDAHPSHPGQSRNATIRRLGDRIKHLLRKS